MAIRIVEFLTRKNGERKMISKKKGWEKISPPKFGFKSLVELLHRIGSLPSSTSLFLTRATRYRSWRSTGDASCSPPPQHPSKRLFVSVSFGSHRQRHRLKIRLSAATRCMEGFFPTKPVQSLPIDVRRLVPTKIADGRIASNRIVTAVGQDVDAAALGDGCRLACSSLNSCRIYLLSLYR